MTIFKINKFFIFIVLIFSLSLSLYSQDNNWVIRIRDSQGELKKLFTVNDFMREVSNIANLRGLPAENLNALLTNDLQLWQFVSTLIEQELIYIKAVEEGFDKDEELTLAISQERDNQIAQLYMQKKVRDDFSVVSEEEKRNFFNNNRERLQAAMGNASDFVKSYANFATTSTYDNGIYNAVTKILKDEKTSIKDITLT